MSNKPSGSSSDLERARRASRRLAGLDPSSGDRDSAGYVRFTAERFALAPREAAPREPPPLFGPALWNSMLDECLSASGEGAEVAFVTDDNGLVVAVRGEMDPTLIQGIGARLVIAFEQASQMAEMGSASRSLAIEFGERWLTGIRIRRGEGQVFTVGVLGKSVVTRETRRAMERMLSGA